MFLLKTNQHCCFFIEYFKKMLLVLSKLINFAPDFA